VDPRVRPIWATNRDLEGLPMVAKGWGNEEITSALRIGVGDARRGYPVGIRHMLARI